WFRAFEGSNFPLPILLPSSNEDSLRIAYFGSILSLLTDDTRRASSRVTTLEWYWLILVPSGIQVATFLDGTPKHIQASTSMDQALQFQRVNARNRRGLHLHATSRGTSQREIQANEDGHTRLKRVLNVIVTGAVFRLGEDMKIYIIIFIVF